MTAHFKFGDGFAIRYGGYRDIQWFFGNNFSAARSSPGLPPLHPAAIAVEAIKGG